MRNLRIIARLFDRDLALQPVVPGAPDGPHPAMPERLVEPVRTDPLRLTVAEKFQNLLPAKVSGWRAHSTCTEAPRYHEARAPQAGHGLPKERLGGGIPAAGLKEGHEVLQADRHVREGTVRETPPRGAILSWSSCT